MLTVHPGDFPALERAFIERLRALGPGTPVAVVTPSRRLADRLQRLACVEGGLSLLGTRFHTFFSLAQEVLEHDPPHGRLVGDPVFHDRLVDQLLEERPAAARPFGAARPRALSGAIRSSLRDLIDAGVDPEALREAFGDDLPAPAEDRARLEALLVLAKAYEERLAALGVLSPSALTRRAARACEASPALGRYQEVLYYGFYDLTGLQLEFFEAVARRTSARLYFPYLKGHPAFRFADAFFEQRLLAHRVEPVPAGAPPALWGALEALFRPEVAGGKSPALSVISVSGARDEAWAAAKEALRLVESEGYAFEEIGVVARSLEPYRQPLLESFRDNAVPFDLGGGEPLLRHPLAKLAFNLLTLRARDFPALVIEDLFSSPYYDRLGRGVNPVYHWRQAIRFLGIHAGWLQWRGKLERRCQADLQLQPAEAREGREGYLIPKEDLASLWKLVSGLEAALRDESAPTWAGKARAARTLLESHLRLPEEPEAGESAAWAAVLDAVDSLAAFDLLGGACSWEAFLEALEDKLRMASLEAGEGARGVRVRGAMDARGESFRALIVLGLKEKLFPRQVQEDPLLRDAVRAALRHPAGYWIAAKGAGHEEERLLFYLTVAAARERLICVFPRSDDGGKAEVPSLYLRELCRAAASPLERAQVVPRQPAGKLQELDPALASPREVSLRSALEGGSAADLREALGEDAAGLRRALERAPALNSWGPPGPLDGLVGPPGEYLKALRRHGLSPSALDELAECPFRFFSGRLLGLSEAGQASEKGQFASWVRGQIYHAALERFHRRLEEGGIGEDAALKGAIDSVFREFDWQTMGVYPLLWRAAKTAITERLEAFAAWDLLELRRLGMRPRWLEKKLSGPMPAELPEALSELQARGVADRIDLDEKGKRFRVIDYKTSWKMKGKLSDLVLKGKLHQLPLYAELAGRALGPDWTLEGCQLFVLEDPEQPTRDYPAAKWAADRGAFLEALGESVARVAAGRFPPRPDDGDFGYCGRCDFASLCRKSHGPSRRRAALADAADVPA